MSKLVFAQSFIADLAQVEQASKREEIFRHIELLQDYPEIGSSNLPESIRTRYGHVRKLVVKPFDIVYEFVESKDEVHILGLVHVRSAR